MPEHPCPICGQPVRTDPRYPEAICLACHARAVDANGRALIFSNLDMTGGFRATIAETGEEHPGHLCYIDGIECRADEAYMGGIVVTVNKRE
jgi:hypothetical protein